MGLNEAVVIESPCVGICTIDRTRDLCTGCGRTLREIAGWTAMTPDARKAVMATLPERLKTVKPVAADRKGGRAGRLKRLQGNPGQGA